MTPMRAGAGTSAAGAEALRHRPTLQQAERRRRAFQSWHTAVCREGRMVIESCSLPDRGLNWSTHGTKKVPHCLVAETKFRKPVPVASHSDASSGSKGLGDTYPRRGRTPRLQAACDGGQWPGDMVRRATDNGRAGRSPRATTSGIPPWPVRTRVRCWRAGNQASDRLGSAHSSNSEITVGGSTPARDVRDCRLSRRGSKTGFVTPRQEGERHRVSNLRVSIFYVLGDTARLVEQLASTAGTSPSGTPVAGDAPGDQPMADYIAYRWSSPRSCSSWHGASRSSRS